MLSEYFTLVNYGRMGLSMLKDKKSLEQYIESESIKIIINPDTCKKLYDFVNKTYNIPKGLAADILSLRKSYSEVSEFVLFCMLDGLEKVNEIKKSKIDEYFTMQEVQTYRKAQYEVDTIKFPLVFKMIAISYDQWIGSISINQLMELRRAQLINYNVNAQRTMQKVIRGDKEMYKIALNWKAIDQIESSYKSKQFISNTLTLNIPTNTENDFYYDEESSSLIIKSLEHFDITDGYHRYIAACQRKDKDPEFDYAMELRIVNFSDDKAKQFIFQEDQKTKMKKIDSDSLNMTKAANMVVTKVNEDYRCNLQGLISRNNGLISFGELAEVVDYFYFKDVRAKEKEKITIINTTKTLVDNLNYLTEYDTKYLEQKYNFKLLVVICYCFNTYPNRNKDEVCQLINDVYLRLENLDIKKFYTKKVRKSLINEIEKIVKECEK